MTKKLNDHFGEFCDCFFGETEITSHSECTPIPCDSIREDVIIGDDKFRLNSGFALTQMFDFEKCLSIRCSKELCHCEKDHDDQKWYIEKILPVQVVIAEFRKDKILPPPCR
ncbi:hypothetical protein [Jeotgalibacillus marinus]|uniref:Spore coat protein n=1 Tax=Jeotgalibacillus marinus TaxID=86667 RepID=A0ABV3Q431_9BACL